MIILYICMACISLLHSPLRYASTACCPCPRQVTCLAASFLSCSLLQCHRIRSCCQQLLRSKRCGVPPRLGFHARPAPAAPCSSGLAGRIRKCILKAPDGQRYHSSSREDRISVFWRKQQSFLFLTLWDLLDCLIAFKLPIQALPCRSLAPQRGLHRQSCMFTSRQARDRHTGPKGLCGTAKSWAWSNPTSAAPPESAAALGTQLPAQLLPMHLHGQGTSNVDAKHAEW